MKTEEHADESGYNIMPKIHYTTYSYFSVQMNNFLSEIETDFEEQVT